jgi:hypothetical protein
MVKNKFGNPIKNAFVIYLGIQKDSTNYERIEYGLLDLIGKAGGFVSAIFRVFVVIVSISCRENVDSFLMYLIY